MKFNSEIEFLAKIWTIVHNNGTKECLLFREINKSIFITISHNGIVVPPCFAYV